MTHTTETFYLSGKEFSQLPVLTELDIEQNKHSADSSLETYYWGISKSHTLVAPSHPRHKLKRGIENRYSENHCFFRIPVLETCISITHYTCVCEIWNLKSACPEAGIWKWVTLLWCDLVLLAPRIHISVSFSPQELWGNYTILFVKSSLKQQWMLVLVKESYRKGRS